MKAIALRAAKWMLEKYAPEFHIHRSPTRKERPKVPGVLNMTREQYMALRRVRGAPDPKDFDSPEEYQHEFEKYQMMVEARMEGDR
jgi:hypothetical protein